ncbi:MAG TPA: transglycosylase domain-containing protein [Micromonosporaceae bacterium]|nr:transglycosylase domain-containing protein [Micromonosporaceae bacterium]
MMKRAVSATTRLVPLVRAGLIAGVTVAAVAYPLAAAGGLGLRAGADAIRDMPANLIIPPLAQTTYVYASDGKTLLTEFYDENRTAVPIDDMSPYIQQAIVAAEDGRFYEHHGVDVRGVARAFVANDQAGAVSQGASTLTMQYVRNALRDGARTPEAALDATEETPGRKLREMKLALDLETKLSKQQILQGYLNLAYFGHRAYGVYAAAHTYFSVEPSHLTLDQAALIAGLVQAPTTYDPAGKDKTAALQRRNYVIARMQTLGYISAAEAATAQRAPIQLKLSSPPNDCVSVAPSHNDWGFFCDEFKQWWLAQPAFGKTQQDRLDALQRGGYRVVTSLDPHIQDIAQTKIVHNLSKNSKFALGEVLIQPGTGRVKAMAVNRTYSLDQSDNKMSSDPFKRRNGIKGNYPNTVAMLDGGGDLPGYQAGSTFKIFTMLAALDMGYKLNLAYYAPPKIRTIYLDGGPASCGGRWCPANAGGGDTGRQTMWSGFGMSVNTYWVQVEEHIGSGNAVQMAQRLGLHFRTPIDQYEASPAKRNQWGAFTLGVANAQPLEIANVFATVAAQGIYCEPLPVTSITHADGKPAMTTSNGEQVRIDAPRCHRVFSQDVARAATDAARCVTGYGAARGSCGGTPTAGDVYGTVGRPIAGKTGTTDENRTAWFSCFTPQLAGSAFVADPDSANDPAGGGLHPLPRVALSTTFADAVKGMPVMGFTPPSSAMLGRSHPHALPPVPND